MQARQRKDKARGGELDLLGLTQWTLGARSANGRLTFSLGDGRRLAWQSKSPAEWSPGAEVPTTAGSFLGEALAGQLAGATPRVLNIQYDAPLDAIPWESLDLGSARLAEHFVLARQLISDAEPTQAPIEALADELAVTVIHDEEPGPVHRAQRVSLKQLDDGRDLEGVMSAHVLVLDGMTLSQWLARSGLKPKARLLVLEGDESTTQVAAALDTGAAVLSMGRQGSLSAESLDALMYQLSSGDCVGEAVRGLYRRSKGVGMAVKLYGDPTLRFVRHQPPMVRRQVTSLSFDLVGSTAMLEQLGDEAYADLLSSLHARCTDVVRRLGGQPDNPQGNDGVMSYFGHPAALEGAAVRAVQAGLRLVQTVAELGVSVRVGIATGLVAVRDGQPVGLSIHLAARLQQVTEPGRVLISAFTRRLLGDAFELQQLQSQPALKGIHAAEALHFVISEVQCPVASHVTPLVGRDAELRILLARWSLTRQGDGRVVVVCADPGMGKSRLVREFRHQLVGGDVKVLECRCRADASSSPFLTLAEALRRWLDIGAGEHTPNAIAKLHAALPDSARQDGPLALMAALLELEDPPKSSAPGGLRQRMLKLLLDWFSAFAKHQPCCLIVEDWHWADPSLRELVERLVARTSGPALCVVITTRQGGVFAPALLARAERIELTGLPPELARELVTLASPDVSLPASLVRWLAERADGVPLFLEEATRMAIELGANRPGTDWSALDTVPASLQDLLMARLDGLGTARQVAQVAAVLGREFSAELLGVLLESGPFAIDSATLAERIATLVGSGLVREESDGQFSFKHALIRDVAYASLWARDRLALHARMVALLQGRWSALARLRPELLALHLTEAGMNAEALVQWDRAASNAAARSAELEAVSHLRRALVVLARLEPGPERDRTALRLQLLLAARLIATEGYGAESVLQAYLEAQRLCDGLGDGVARFKVEMGLEAYRFMRADFGPALDHGRRAADIAAASGDIKQRLQAHWGLACTLFHQGNLRATMREMETALMAYTPALHPMFGIQDPGIMCMAYSAWGLWERARPDAALARINHAVAMAGEFEHKFCQAVALAYGVSVEMLRGEIDAALRRAEQCIAVCDEGGYPVWLAITRCMRGRMLCELGAFDEGLREMRAGYTQWLATGALVSQPLYLSLQAEGLLLAGQANAAAACVEQGLAVVQRYGERQLEAELCRLQGELALQLSAPQDAEHWFKTAYALALRQHRLGFALRAATSLAALWARTGRGEQARRLLTPLTARWQEGRGTRDVGLAEELCRTLARRSADDHRGKQ